MYMIAIVFSLVCDITFLRFMYEASGTATAMSAGSVRLYFRCVFHHSWKLSILPSYVSSTLK